MSSKVSELAPSPGVWTAGRDLPGHVYEYFLGLFASADGKRGGQFYTPRSTTHRHLHPLHHAG